MTRAASRADWSGAERAATPPRAVQYFSTEYLARCQAFSAQDIVRFLDEFKRNYYAAQAGRAASAGGGGAARVAAMDHESRRTISP